MLIERLASRLRHHRKAQAPSLYDLVPNANALARSMPRLEVVPATSIEGTTRHPSNTTVDFLPPTGPTAHWRDDLRRILDAQETMTVLPPVDLIKAADRYFVVDGHKRVAAARRIGGTLDANVVELRVS